jgi:hypothetical protein
VHEHHVLTRRAETLTPWHIGQITQWPGSSRMLCSHPLTSVTKVQHPQRLLCPVQNLQWCQATSPDPASAGPDARLRLYLPNVDYDVFPASDGSQHPDGDGQQPPHVTPQAISGSPGHGLALIATRDVKDEEVLLNYR